MKIYRISFIRVKHLSIFLKFYECKSCHVTKIAKKYYTLKISYITYIYYIIYYTVKYPIFTRDILRTEFYQNLWQTHILHLNGKTRDIYIYISRLQCRMNVIHKIPAPKASHKRHCITRYRTCKCKRVSTFIVDVVLSSIW